eukprot:SAG11_NODE_1236_length_5426_cov_10.879857_3_plen_47_part_00
MLKEALILQVLTFYTIRALICVHIFISRGISMECGEETDLRILQEP